MSLDLAVKHALRNPIRPIGRSSISRTAAVLTDGYNTYIGLNSYKSHPLQARFSGNPEKICIHAEIAAIARAAKAEYSNSFYRGRVKRGGRGDDLKEYEMYIARVLADGTPALAKPCEGCSAAIAEFGIKDIYWTK